MLSRAMQIQAVADLLASRPPAPDLSAGCFIAPWDACAAALLPLFAGGARPTLDDTKQALLDALAERADRDDIINILKRAPGNGPRALPSFDDVMAGLPEPEDLWPRWIPLRMLTLFGAAPGAGKTYVALDLLRRVINGEPWPDGQPMNPKFAGGRVIYVNAEGADQILKARLEAWQFDHSRLSVMQPDRGKLIDFARTEDRDVLIEGVAADRPVLVIIDSFGMISSKGENAIEDVRFIIGFCSDLAAAFGCAVVLIHHLRKRNVLAAGEELSQDDFRGSGHITAAPRSVIGLTPMQTRPRLDPNGPRKLEQVKNNLGPRPQPLKVEFEEISRCAAKLTYSPLEEEPGPARRDFCASWLVETLREAGEPLAPKEIVELARAQDFSARMVYRARETLGDLIRDTRGRHHPKNKWRLAESA